MNSTSDSIPLEVKNDPRLKRARRQGWIPIIIVAVLALGLSYFVIAQLIPARAVDIYSSHFVEKEVCPLDEVHLVSDFQVNDYDITYLSYASTWEELGQPTNTQPAGEAIFDKPKEVKPVDRAKRASPFVRTAPTQPGLWQLQTDVVASFDVWGIPRLQEQRYPTTGVLSVVPLTSKKCLKGQ